MEKAKNKYMVYNSEGVCVGETYAKSSAQAINNVLFKMNGKLGVYLDKAKCYAVEVFDG